MVGTHKQGAVRPRQRTDSRSVLADGYLRITSFWQALRPLAPKTSKGWLDMFRLL